MRDFDVKSWDVRCYIISQLGATLRTQVDQAYSQLKGYKGYFFTFQEKTGQETKLSQKKEKKRKETESLLKDPTGAWLQLHFETIPVVWFRLLSQTERNEVTEPTLSKNFHQEGSFEGNEHHLLKHKVKLVLVVWMEQLERLSERPGQAGFHEWEAEGQKCRDLKHRHRGWSAYKRWVRKLLSDNNKIEFDRVGKCRDIKAGQTPGNAEKRVPKRMRANLNNLKNLMLTKQTQWI